MDIEATERGRSSGLSHSFSFQAVKTLVTGYGGGVVGESKAASLMANFVVNIMANQIDAPTREHDQKMVGTIKTVVKTWGENWKVGDPVNANQDGGGQSESYSTQWLPSLPEDWMHGLETGQHGYIQTFVYIGGRTFFWNHKKWLLVRWPRNVRAWNWWKAWREKWPTARPCFGYVSLRDLWEALKRQDEEPFKRWANFWMGGRDA
jgi:hypothetical protein